MGGATRTTEKLKCSCCDKVFSRSNNLARHTKQKHGYEGPSFWKCAVCGISFSRRDSLLSHEQRKHGLLKTKEKKSLRCLKCSKQFQFSSDLKRHEISHHVESLPGFDQLKLVLPAGYLNEYRSLSLKKNGFLAKFEILEFQAHQINEWLNDFQKKNYVTLRVMQSRKTQSESSFSLQNKSYRCHHNTRRKATAVKFKRLSKNTNCPAFLRLNLRRTKRKTTKLVVLLQHTHNHPLRAASTLRFRDPSSDVREKFIEMFKSGHSPSRSLKIHKQHLQLEYGDDYYLVAGDRKHCPDLQWVFTQYYKLFKRVRGNSSGIAAIESLKKTVTEYNVKCGSNHSVFKMMPDGSNFYVAILTPMMQRVSTLKSAGEIMFVDSSGSVDRFGCKIFSLLANSCVGGLPVGCVITTSESCDILQSAFADLAGLYGKASFGSRGSNGPLIIMTDDCAAERKALSLVFPKSVLLLCIFHVLQTVWRWLWDGSHGVKKIDRPQLLNYVKAMMYAENTSELENKFSETPDVLLKYPLFKSYVGNLFDRRREWALCYRAQILTRGQNTNNLCEQAAMRILKDKVLLRTRAFSPSQLFEFIVKDFDSYYERKIISAASYRPEQYRRKKEINESKIEFSGLKIISSDGDTHVVENKNRKTRYVVDLHLFLCECFVGKTGRSCKHILFACESTGSTKPLVLTTQQRHTLYYVAVGRKNFPPDWFTPLDATESPQETTMEMEEGVEVIRGENEKEDVPGNLRDGSLACTSDSNETHRPPSFAGSSAGHVAPLTLKLRSLLGKMCDTMDAKPEVFSGAVAAAEKRLSRVHTEAGLVSVVYNIGGFLET